MNMARSLIQIISPSLNKHYFTFKRKRIQQESPLSLYSSRVQAIFYVGLQIIITQMTAAYKPGTTSSCKYLLYPRHSVLKGLYNKITIYYVELLACSHLQLVFRQRSKGQEDVSKFEGVLNFKLCNVVGIIKHDKYCLRWGFYNFMPSEDILILLKVKKKYFKFASQRDF